MNPLGAAEGAAVSNPPSRISIPVLLALAIGAAIFTNWPMLAKGLPQAITEHNLGATLQEAGRIDEAIEHYRQAIALKPDYASSMVGKWHLGHVAPFWPPTVQGFDLFFCLPYSHDLQPLCLYPSGPGVELGLYDALGTVEPGKVSDLVLLVADPVVDSAKTRRIHGVIRGGRFFGPEDGQRLLETARAEAARAVHSPPANQ